MSSSDSSDDEGSVYTNAALKLSALKQKSKQVFPKSENYRKESSTLSKECKLSPKNEKDKKKSSDDNLILLEESSSESELNEVEEVVKVSDDDLVMYIDDSEEDSNARRSKRIATRASTKKVKEKNLRKRKASIDSEKTITAIPGRIEEQKKKSFDDSIEKELNKSFNDSFLDLSQDEKEGDYLLIGSPPPEKKSNTDNYEVNIKILWRSNKIERFELRKHETFQKIFRHFSKVEEVPEKQIVITKDSKPITPYETPASINWSIVDILEGGIVSAALVKMNKGQQAQNQVDENVCKIKIQTSDKRTLSVALKHDETFGTLVSRCVEELNIPESKMKFYFDGELIDTDETPESLDLDDEACIDLKISK